MNKSRLMKNFRSASFAIFVFLSVMHLSDICYAQYLTGPVASALGGAGRAASDDGEQIFLNPAAIVHASVFSSSLFYEDGYVAEDDRHSRYGFSLADNSDDVLFSGGYSFARSKDTFANGDLREEDYHQISIGRFFAKHLSVGLALTYLITDIKNDDKYSQFDAHLGALYNPDPNYGMGIVFYNLRPRDTSTPLEIQNLDSVAVGGHYIFMPMFRMRFDVREQLVYNPQQLREYLFGVESKFSEFWTSRFGVQRDDLLRKDFYTLGLGFDGPKLKIDYFYRKNADFNDGAMHGVDLRMGFW